MKSFVIESTEQIPAAGPVRPQFVTMTSFEEYKQRKALALSSLRTSAKYLGPPNDPHFIPDSPIISRQELSMSEESELKRVCALVLAQIPHSDDMNEDPAKYLLRQVNAKKAMLKQIEQEEKLRESEKPRMKDWNEWRREKHAAAAAAAAANSAQVTESKEDDSSSEPRSILNDDDYTDTSSPSSDRSKRETLGTTKSTPWTTPGFSPGLRSGSVVPGATRPVTANPESLAKTKTKSSRENDKKVYAFLNEMGTIYTPKVTPAARSMTYLPASDKAHYPKDKESQSKRKRSKDHRHQLPMERPEMNKSLPNIPRRRTEDRSFNRMEPTIRLVDSPARLENDKHHVPRALKTSRRTRTHPDYAEECQCGAPEYTSNLRNVRSQPLQRPSSPPKKKGFDFTSFFQRRRTLDVRTIDAKQLIAITA